LFKEMAAAVKRRI